jgi:hypothetical protein
LLIYCGVAGAGADAGGVAGAGADAGGVAGAVDVAGGVAAGGCVVVVSGAGAVTGGALVRGQYDQATANTTTIAAKPIHMVRDERRTGVALRSGVGLLKSFVME